MMHSNQWKAGFMRKPDDDLKIDIAELFGEDMPSPSDTLEDSSAPTATASAETVSEASTADTETRFQEWMNGRNKELETKVQELEQRLQDVKAKPPAPVEPDNFSGDELKSAVVPPPEVKPAPVSPPQVKAAPAPPPEVKSAPAPPPEIKPAPASEPEAKAVPSSESPIDFSAPIAPPFMGGSPVSPAVGEAAPAAGAGEVPPPPDPQEIEKMRKLQADHEFLMLYDEYRNIIAHELTDLVGEKKTNTMLGRTVELSREKFPEIFRNANWDESGNLLEDGTVDSQRIIDNKNALDPQKADTVLDAALSILLNLRLQAVEKGLGTGLKNKVRARMYQWITEKLKRAGQEKKDTSNLKRLASFVS